jgi:Na+/H+-dicarboxylate symporter
MFIAPLGVFALISATVAEFGFNILQTLIWYMASVLLGLFIHTAGTYSLIIKLFSKLNVVSFFKGMRKAQAIAFSTSSSAATLPVNMECVEENLGVSKSVTSFVLPLGATINMDGTALYQGVAAVFIAQVFGIELSFIQQLTIVLTATLASIGTAPVPGVGIIMLVIILKAVGIPEEGIALILGVDRILDMCRTVTNITGDAAVAVAIASSEKEIGSIKRLD